MKLIQICVNPDPRPLEDGNDMVIIGLDDQGNVWECLPWDGGDNEWQPLRYPSPFTTSEEAIDAAEAHYHAKGPDAGRR